MKMVLGGYTFIYVGNLELKRDKNGDIIIDTPQVRYNNSRGIALHEYGCGGFCRFRLPNATDVSGVYVWVVDGTPIYIGETRKLKTRFNNGYGRISPRNCFKGGQKTNCRMNKLAKDICHEKIIKIYFLQTNDYKKIEKELIERCHPTYNVKGN